MVVLGTNVDVVGSRKYGIMLAVKPKACANSCLAVLRATAAVAEAIAFGQ
jgi:hypothetical protein